MGSLLAMLSSVWSVAPQIHWLLIAVRTDRLLDMGSECPKLVAPHRLRLVEPCLKGDEGFLTQPKHPSTSIAGISIVLHHSALEEYAQVATHG
jgi:hypothetical protein